MAISLKSKITFSALLAALLMGLIIVVAAVINIRYNIERIDLYRQHEAVSIAKVLDASFQSKNDLMDISFAQGLINRLLISTLDIKRISIHAAAPEGKSPSGYWHLASSAPERIGRPSDPEDIEAIKSGLIIILTESSSEPVSEDEYTVDVTYPLHDLAGKVIGVAGITLYYDIAEGEKIEHEADEARKKALTIGQSLDASITSERQLTHRNYAQVEIDDIVKKLPHISRFSIHAAAPRGKSPSGYWHLASSAPERIGRPSDPEDIEAINNDKHVVLFEADAERNRHIDVTYPIHNLEGKAIAAAGITISLKEEDAILAEANKRTFINALWFMLGIFVVGVIFSLFFSSYIARLISEPIKQYESKIKTSLQEKEILLREVHHRVKNNMNVTVSLLNLQSRYVKDKAALDIFKESQTRIKTMARVHEKLYKAEDFTNIDTNDYIRTLVNDLFKAYHVDTNEIYFSIDANNILLSIDSLIPCGLIINEIVSNSLKHAFGESHKGEINISLSADGPDRILVISDNGVGIPEEHEIDNSETLGLILVSSLVGQLRGKVEVDSTEGTTYTITFPAETGQA
jgi:two-component sensor histidine kinase